jgi:hypothetical protein
MTWALEKMMAIPPHQQILKRGEKATMMKVLEEVRKFI